MVFVFLTALVVGIFGGILLLAVTRDEDTDCESDLTKEEVVATTVATTTLTNLNNQ